LNAVNCAIAGRPLQPAGRRSATTTTAAFGDDEISECGCTAGRTSISISIDRRLCRTPRAARANSHIDGRR
jgi:hypothetical protein